MAILPRTIKHIFLNFAQEYFTLHKKYTWDIDVKKTDILIVEKLGKDLGKAITRPTIVLSRGALSYGFVPRNQEGTNAILSHQKGLKTLMGYAPNAGTFTTTSYTDLVSGYVIYQILAKTEAEVDEISDYLQTGLVGYKEEFRSLGIIKFNNLSISETQLISIKTEPEFIGVNVTLGFSTQNTIFKDARDYSLKVFVDDEEVKENIQFKVINNGTQIQFLYDTPIEFTKITADYVHAITLQALENVGLIQSSSDPNIFTLPNGGRIQNYYNIVKDIEVDITNAD